MSDFVLQQTIEKVFFFLFFLICSTIACIGRTVQSPVMSPIGFLKSAGLVVVLSV